MKEVFQTLLLYVHIPFCSSKCNFCFKTNKISCKDLLNKNIHKDYVEALIRSIDFYAPILKKRYMPIGINWGGGTPTIFNTTLLERIAEAFLPYWDISAMPFSVEATPETLTDTTLRVLKKIRVNRLSIGVQSFNDTTLQAMGRSHSADEARDVIKMAKDYGFTDLNVDLIVSYPYEKLDSVQQTLEMAFELHIPHITTYFYNPAPNTLSLKKVLQNPASFWSLSEHMRCLEALSQMMNKSGYYNYEFFHWSSDPSKWQYTSLDHYFGHSGDVFGFGSGAQSFLSRMGNQEMKDLNEYLTDSITMLPGKLDLEYSLERSLGCKVGLNYSNMSRTFGLSEENVKRHRLTRKLMSLPGVKCSEDGITMSREAYMREHTIGIHSRIERLSALTHSEREKVCIVL